MAGASCLAIECRRAGSSSACAPAISTSRPKDLDEALAIIGRRRRREGRPVGLLGNAADVLPELVRRASRPMVTDQTSAHDPVNGYLPPVGRLPNGRHGGPPTRPASPGRRQAIDGGPRARHAGVPPARRADVDYGNNIRQMALEEGVADAFSFRASCRPTSALFCRGGRSAGRAVGRPGGHLPDRRAGEGAVARQRHLHTWLDMARKRIASSRACQPRICWVGWAIAIAGSPPSTRWWQRASPVEAPIVIGRDHLDSGSVASPNRETEAMRDGSDAVSDWPLLNALLNCASGATGGRCITAAASASGFSQHAGMVIVCDGTPEAARRIERVLWKRSGDRRDAPRRCRLRGGDRLRPGERSDPAEPVGPHLPGT